MYDTVNMVRVTGFNPQEVEQRAHSIGIQLTEQHWEAIKFIKNFYDYHEDEELEIRDYNNAFKGKYADKGGLQYLYQLFPDGPITTLTQLAGISDVKNTSNPSSGFAQ